MKINKIGKEQIVDLMLMIAVALSLIAIMKILFAYNVKIKLDNESVWFLIVFAMLLYSMYSIYFKEVSYGALWLISEYFLSLGITMIIASFVYSYYEDSIINVEIKEMFNSLNREMNTWANLIMMLLGTLNCFIGFAFYNMYEKKTNKFKR